MIRPRPRNRHLILKLCEREIWNPAKKSEEAVDVRWDVPESVRDAMIEDVAREAPPAGSDGSLYVTSVRNSSVVA
jgi:hypothetical protein